MDSLIEHDWVMQLPETTAMQVPEGFLDENHHMNIQHYLMLGALAVSKRCRAAGLDQRLIEVDGLTVFTAEHHLTYVSELRLGESLSVHVRMIARSDKALHAMAFILNRSKRRVAFMLEVVLIHVSMETRRPVPFGERVSERLDAEIENCSGLDWEAPICGVMGIRSASL